MKHQVYAQGERLYEVMERAVQVVKDRTKGFDSQGGDDLKWNAYLQIIPLHLIVASRWLMGYRSNY